VIDVSIRDKDDDGRKSKRNYLFSDGIKFISTEFGLELSSDLSRINNNFSNDPTRCMTYILAGKITDSKDDISFDKPKKKDLSMAYILRNHRAHNTDSITGLSKHFLAVTQSLLNVMLYVIENLYSNPKDAL
jgi:hypothetical protein